MDSLLPSLTGFLLALILCNAGFSFGAALQNLNEKELTAALKTNDRRAGELLRQKERPGRSMRSLQLLTMLLDFPVGGVYLLPLMVLLVKAAFWSGLPTARVISAVPVYGFTTIPFAAFGTTLPKWLAERDSEKTARRALRLVHIFMAVLFVPEWTARDLVNVVLRLCGINPEKSGENVIEEDIMFMVNEGHEQGVIESDEAKMATDIFRLNDKTTEDIMTQRKRVIALNAEMKLSNVVAFLSQENVHPCFPVYREDIDHIIGILYLRGAISFAQTPSRRNKMLSELLGLLRDTHFMPGARVADALSRETQYRKLQMVTVVDEYDQTDDVVSMEDILEEIVDNIVDEYDRDEEEIRVLSDGSRIIHGFTHLSNAEEVSGIPFIKEEFENFDTPNGFLIVRLDHFPEDNERASIQAHGYLFQILKVENRMIKTVKVEWQKD